MRREVVLKPNYGTRRCVATEQDKGCSLALLGIDGAEDVDRADPLICRPIDPLAPRDFHHEAGEPF